MSYLAPSVAPARRRLGILQTSAKRSRSFHGLGLVRVSPSRLATPASVFHASHIMPYRGNPITRWLANSSTGTSSSTGTGTSTTGTGATNPAGGPPSTIDHWDAQGNPVYSVPPPGASITGYDASGNPIYSNSPAAGSVIVGYDASGNPIYANPNSLLANSGYYGSSYQPGSAGASPSTAVTVAPTTDYSTILDWFTEQTLVSGIPNWGIVAGLAIAWVWIEHKGRR